MMASHRQSHLEFAQNSMNRPFENKPAMVTGHTLPPDGGKLP